MTELAVSRRLAAILAADIAGYSRLMGEDETATVRDLKAHQAVVLPLIARFSGRIIDTAGAQQRLGDRYSRRTRLIADRRVPQYPLHRILRPDNGRDRRRTTRTAGNTLSC